MLPDDQLALFGELPENAGPALPDGWAYRPEFIDTAEEAALLEMIATLPLQEARYKGYTARRRVAGFGLSYDSDAQRPRAAPDMPIEFAALRERAAAWIEVAADALTSVLVAEYRPGVPLGWHRDAPVFETVVGISLAGTARMRFRRYPPLQPKKADVLSLELAPRSAYVLRAEARWGWQHSVAPTPQLRYSITFRTARMGR
ncbi:MAG TPA: alpha-ketoglutarate-dependent dioxygenase AlkB [Caldimonas sp.]|nr:alpha-ketoglutarate-dependent dioxygenase AlkB [Caldimonas sp.]HEX2540072.1 alpha-ketoglutarate-dependent dioxygenase AlkB [Caldimonas sp.]